MKNIKYKQKGKPRSLINPVLSTIANANGAEFMYHMPEQALSAS